MARTGVRIHGLREFQRAVRRVDRAASRELNKELRNAAKIVTNAAKPRVPYGPAAGGHIRSSVRGYARTGSAGARIGGPRFPYVFWLEYGGRVGRNDSVRRARSRSGRYLLPAYLANRRRVITGMVAALGRAVRGSGMSRGR